LAFVPVPAGCSAGIHRSFIPAMPFFISSNIFMFPPPCAAAANAFSKESGHEDCHDYAHSKSHNRKNPPPTHPRTVPITHIAFLLYRVINSIDEEEREKDTVFLLPMFLSLFLFCA
jgi:hypothetical protein